MRISSSVFWSIVVLVGVALAWPTTAQAERRLAMVVGINTYPAFGADAQLQRAVADADAVSQSLSQLGFTVTTLSNGAAVTQDGLLKRISIFVDSIQPGDMVAFYFAGHGVGIDGSNYLVPADMPNLVDPDGYMFRAHALAETDIRTRILSHAPSVVLLMLDACRDNPFRSTSRGLPFSRGLQPIQASKGVLTIYAAGYGQTALDRLSDVGDASPNSLFTRVLVDELGRSGINLVDLSEDVRERVASIARSAGYDQVPAVDNQLLGGRSIFLGGRSDAPSALPSPGQGADEIAWNLIRDSSDVGVLRRFLQRFPESGRQAEIQARLAALKPPSPVADGSPVPPSAPTARQDGPGQMTVSSAEAVKLDPDTKIIDINKTSSSTDEYSDIESWNHISNSIFKSDVDDFMAKFPTSPFRKSAEIRLQKLDDDLWNQTDIKDIVSLNHYLGTFPEGIHATQAQAILDGLGRASVHADTSGNGPQPATSASSTPLDVDRHQTPEGDDVAERREMMAVRIGRAIVRLETVVVKPPGPGPFPIALITHGVPSDHSKLGEMTTDSVSAQAHDFAHRGWLAVGVVRRGFGHSEGGFVEGDPSCGSRDYRKQLSVADDDITAALAEVSNWPEADASRVLAVGNSVGGAVMLTFAARRPQGLVGVINVSGGHGSDGHDHVCNEDGLVNLFNELGRKVNVPTLWLYASHDSYFSDQLIKRMYDSFVRSGGKADLPDLGIVGYDGHKIWSDWRGRARWLPEVDKFLRSQNLPTWDPALIDPLIVTLPTSNLPVLDAYLAAGAEKALAMASTGALWYYSGAESSERSVLEATSGCRKTFGTDCRLLMRNFDVVRP